MRTILKEIDELFIKQTLANYQKIIDDIQQRLFESYVALENTDDLFKELSYKSIDYAQIGSGNSGGDKKGLDNILIRHQSLSFERSKDIRTDMYSLVEEEESRDRIWWCYKALDGNGFRYITDLYVKGKPYKEVESDSGVSHKTFEQTRAQAMKDIYNLYNTNLTNGEIILKGSKLIKESKTGKTGKGRRTEQTSFEQMTMFNK